ncbi:MAG: hypothetical protein AAGH90_03820 [Pseudomonadota bacterium]
MKYALLASVAFCIPVALAQVTEQNSTTEIDPLVGDAIIDGTLMEDRVITDDFARDDFDDFYRDEEAEKVLEEYEQESKDFTSDLKVKEEPLEDPS